MSSSKQSDRSLAIYTDGAARGNPGEAGAGVVIKSGEETIEEICRYLGETTNNVAEYNAAIIGLSRAAELCSPRVRLFADSELMVRQLNGEYRVKNNGLIPLYNRAKELIAKIGVVEVIYIPRGRNKEADKLANKAIDERVKS